MRSKIFREKDKLRKAHPSTYDDDTIHRMKQYYRVEEHHNVLLRYLKDHRVHHEALTES